MPTRYPILLVHGVMLKDILFMKSFGNIRSVLTRAGYTVFTSNVDGLGTTDTNADQLHAEVMDILAQTGAEKINLIAHSKGGLDCKKMIEKYGMEDQVASLTTLCTPHKGSPIATALLKLPNWFVRLVSFWLNFWYRIFGDRHPDALAVCQELVLVDKIEDTARDISPKIYCQSYSSTLKSSRDDFIMGIPLIFSHYYGEQDSDGMVSADSAQFGNYRGACVDASASHSEVVDLLPDKKTRQKIYTFYTTLCQELAQRGF